MPSRSPSRQPPPGASRGPRRSPSGASFRGRPSARPSPPPPDKRRRIDSQPAPSRPRERREFQSSPPLARRGPPGDFPLNRRSRSPPLHEGKVRSFSPPPTKRKMSPPPKRERMPRDMDRERPGRAPPRKRSRSKSPPASASHTSVTRMVSSYPSNMSPTRYQPPPDPYSVVEAVGAERMARGIGERFRSSGSGSYEERGQRPVFGGPDGPGYDVNELKKIVVDIRRDLPVNKMPVERNIINPEDVVLVRRPGEGSRPIFAREEIMQASAERPVDAHRRIVEIHDREPAHSSGSQVRYESSPPPRYSEGRVRETYYVSEHRDAPSTSRDYGRPARDYERPSTSSSGYDKRDDRYERRGEDLRHELDTRRRDDRYENVRTYERGRDYRGDSDSDLRVRINERRVDRHDERDREPHHHRRGSAERFERRPMGHQPSPPGSIERRRGPVGEGYERGRREPGHSVSPPPPHRHEQPPHERFHQDHPPWEMNPEYVPKGRAYFEHDNRDEMMRVPYRGRGIPNLRGGPMRGRGMMRGRPFVRGPMRGFMGGRATGRRGSYVPRYKPSSPHWEHDLFDNADIGDGKNGTGK